MIIIQIFFEILPLCFFFHEKTFQKAEVNYQVLMLYSSFLDSSEQFNHYSAGAILNMSGLIIFNN